MRLCLENVNSNRVLPHAPAIKMDTRTGRRSDGYYYTPGSVMSPFSQRLTDFVPSASSVRDFVLNIYTR